MVTILETEGLLLLKDNNHKKFNIIFDESTLDSYMERVRIREQRRGLRGYNPSTQCQYLKDDILG